MLKTCSECHYFEPYQKRRCTVREGWMMDVVASSPFCSQFMVSIIPNGRRVMQKTCRTCKFRKPWCILCHDYRTYCNTPQPCDSHQKRVTPLLIDVLAKLLRQAKERADNLRATAEHWKAPPLWWGEIDDALARHQQES